LLLSNPTCTALHDGLLPELTRLLKLAMQRLNTLAAIAGMPEQGGGGGGGMGGGSMGRVVCSFA
jgi:hypothetical protein